MKKLLLITASAWMLCTASVRAQITLDFENDTIAFGPGEFYCIDISDDESKYIHFNKVKNSFSLYNLDMSQFLPDVSLPVGDSLLDGYVVMYVTRTLFDCDSSNIEYAYSKPVSSDRVPFRILRTDGTILLEVDSARGPYHFGGSSGGSTIISPIRKTSEGTKLFLDILNLSGKGIQVYSLCGELPTGYLNILEQESQQSYVNLYPNPSAMKINFEIAPPNNQEEFDLVIYDAYGRELYRKNIKAANDKYTLDFSNFSNGTYFYSLVTKEKSFQTGRFMITK
ncbi:MAG TPA: T9SS type A sorting domain-containing protein [Candidatus Nitrosotenuis sp.]|nr:T9SS type A sorting domain-containing protein [Candidatus Nitrosotenuis sp.]